MIQQLLFTEKEWNKAGWVTSTALAEAEALLIARRKFGPQAYVFDRDTNEVGRSRPAGLKRFYVGTGQELYGNGATWEEALDACGKMAGKAARS